MSKRQFNIQDTSALCVKESEKYFFTSRKKVISDLQEDLEDKKIILIPGAYMSGKTCLCYEWFDLLKKLDENVIWIKLSKTKSCCVELANKLSVDVPPLRDGSKDSPTRIMNPIDDYFRNFGKTNPGKRFYIFFDDLYEKEEYDHSACIKHLKDSFMVEELDFVRIVCNGHDPWMLLASDRTPFRADNIFYSPPFSIEEVSELFTEMAVDYDVGVSFDSEKMCKMVYNEFKGHTGLTCSFLSQVLGSFEERKRRNAGVEMNQIGDFELDLENIILRSIKNFHCPYVSQEAREVGINMDSIVSPTRLLEHFHRLGVDQTAIKDFVNSYLHFESCRKEQDDGTFGNELSILKVGEEDIRRRNEVKRLFRLGFIECFYRKDDIFKFRPLSPFHTHWMLKKYKECFGSVASDLVDEVEGYLNEQEFSRFIQGIMKLVDFEKIKNKRCWSNIWRKGPSEKAYQFEFSRILCDFTNWICFAEYSVGGKRLDLVLEHRKEGTKYNIELIANSPHRSKDDKRHSVSHHWKRNLEKYDQLDTFEKHFCVAFYHGDRVTRHYRPESIEAQILYYILTNRDFSKATFWISTKKELKKEEFDLQEERISMIDEGSVTKVFFVFSYIKDPEKGSRDRINFVNGKQDLQGLRDYLFNILEEGTGKEKAKYFLYDENWDGVNNIMHVMSLQEEITRTLYFVTNEERKRKRKEEEKRKRKEEEEKQRLEKEGKVKVFLVKIKGGASKLLFCDILIEDDLKKHEREDTINLLLGKRIIKNWRNNDVSGLCLLEYVSVKSSIDKVVGDELDVEDEEMFEDFGSHLVGKICFLVTEDESMEINELFVGSRTGGIDIKKLKDFRLRAASGMSFVDKWFDDEPDEDDGTGVFLDRMKYEDCERKNEILLECCDGGVFREHFDDLLQKSRFFRMMMSFEGKEAQEAREHGKIRIEFLSTIELDYYLNVIFGRKDEEFGTFGSLRVNGRIRVLVRLLEFGLRYQERKLAVEIVKELELAVLPDLISCNLLDMKLLEVGYLAYDGLPLGLLEELFDRWCSVLTLGQSAEDMMKLIECSSKAMVGANGYCGKEESDMLGEGGEKTDYGVGEVVVGNGKVLGPCFVGEFGGRKMVWSEGGSGFVRCLRDSERSLFKTKRRRDEEESQDVKCVGEGKVRKLMIFD